MRIDVINKNNHEEFQFKGTGVGGSVCHLHFPTDDIKRVNGQFQLKEGSVPNLNMNHENSNVSTEFGKYTTPNLGINIECIENCRECESLTSQLENEKQLKLKLKLNFEIEQYKMNDQIAKLTQKCNDQADIIDSYQQTIICLQRMLAETTKINKTLGNQFMEFYGATNVQVIMRQRLKFNAHERNTYFISFLMIFR